MSTTPSATWTMEQDRHIAEVIAEQRPRLKNFIRRRVPNEADVEELLQEVFYELVAAERLLKPIDYVTGWLFQVARNRITDLFRKKRTESFAEADLEEESGELLLPSPDAGPEAAYLRRQLLKELRTAVNELPAEQRAVFVAHEIEGRSFKEIAAQSGVNMNTLLGRKHSAVLALRARLKNIHDGLEGK